LIIGFQAMVLVAGELGLCDAERNFDAVARPVLDGVVQTKSTIILLGLLNAIKASKHLHEHIARFKSRKLFWQTVSKSCRCHT
jgi:hypothetical protein